MALALIVAAGSGERLGADQPKALVELAGQPLLQYSVEALTREQRLADRDDPEEARRVAQRAEDGKPAGEAGREEQEDQ